MFARKLMHLMAALAVGLVGFGVVLADDGPPMPPPVPGPQPVALPQPVLTDKDRADDAARLKAQAKGLAGIDAKGQRLIQIDAICMDVPAGFCVEAGLEEKQGSWLLSARETRMFNALIRAQKEKGAVDIITHPKMLVHDNQTGFAQIGQNVPYVASREVKAKDGKPAVEEKIEFQEVGVKLKVTPKINADGKSIELHLDATVSDASTVQVTHGDGTTTPGPAFTFQSIGISVLLPDPGSFVFRAGRTSKDLERIWVVTTHIVKGNAAITSGTKRPTAAKPPLPAPPALALPVPVVPASGAVPLKPVTPMILPNPPHP